MSSQLNTLDHELMRILLSASGGLSFAVLVRLSRQSRSRVYRSINKLVGRAFVSRRVKCGAKPLYFAISHSSYFPPVHDVSGGVFSWDDAELAVLVAECEEKFLTN